MPTRAEQILSEIRAEKVQPSKSAEQVLAEIRAERAAPKKSAEQVLAEIRAKKSPAERGEFEDFSKLAREGIAYTAKHPIKAVGKTMIGVPQQRLAETITQAFAEEYPRLTPYIGLPVSAAVSAGEILALPPIPIIGRLLSKVVGSKTLQKVMAKIKENSAMQQAGKFLTKERRIIAPKAERALMVEPPPAAAQSVIKSLERPTLPSAKRVSPPEIMPALEKPPVQALERLPGAEIAAVPKLTKPSSGPAREIAQWVAKNRSRISREDISRAVDTAERIGRKQGKPLLFPGESEMLRERAMKFPSRTEMGANAKRIKDIEGQLQMFSRTPEETKALMKAGGVPIKNRLMARYEGGVPKLSPQKGIINAITEIKPEPITSNSEKFGNWVVNQVEKIVPGAGKGGAQLISVLHGTPGRKIYEHGRQEMFGKMSRAPEVAKQVFDRLNKLSPESNVRIFDAIRRYIPSSELNPAERIAYDQSIRFSNSLGKELMKRGKITEAAYNANKDQYVHYAYLKHTLSDDVFNAYKSRTNLSPAEQDAMGLIKNLAAVSSVTTENVLKDIIHYDWTDKVAKQFGWAESTIGYKGKKYTLAGLDDEIGKLQKVFEETSSPETAQMMAELNRLKGQLNQRMDDLPKGFAVIPNEKRFDVLAGVAVPKQIYRDVMNIHNAYFRTKEVDNTVNNISKGIHGFNALFKVSHTAFSPATISRNFLSNPGLLLLSGTPMNELGGLTWRGAQHFLAGDGIYKAALKQGLFNTNFSKAELAELMTHLKGIEGKDGLSVIGHIANKLEKISGFYGKIDDFWKMVKFTEGMEKGLGAAESARLANKWIMDYSQVSPAVGYLRRNISPFITFQSKVAPLLAESMIDRPIQTIAYLAAPTAATWYIANKALDMTKEDWDRLQADLPSWIKRNQSFMPMPFKNPKTGRYEWVNLEYFTPWGSLVNTLMNPTPQGLSRLSSFGIPAYDTIKFLSNIGDNEPPKDPFSGRDVYNSFDKQGAKAIKVAQWVAKQALGPVVSGVLGDKTSPIYSLLHIGDIRTSGETITPARAMLEMFGIRTYSPPPKVAIAEREQLIQKANIARHKILRNPSSTPEEIENANNAYFKYKDSIRSGFQTPQEKIVRRFLQERKTK